MDEQKIECEAKIELLNKALKNLKRDIKSVKDLPPKITPEFIYGCTKDERDKKFKEAIAELNRQRLDAIEKSKEFKSKLVKIGEKKLKEIKNQVEPKIKQYKKVVDDLESTLKTMLLNLKNEWTPPPKMEIKLEQEKIEVLNEDVKPNILIISIGKTTITDSNANIHVTLSKIF